MRRSTQTFFTTLLFAFLTIPGRAVAAAVAEYGDASIQHDQAAGTWTLAAGGATLILVIGASRDFAVQRLVTPSGESWTTGNVPDTFVRVGGQTLAFGNRAAGFNYREVTTAASGSKLQLNATFDVPAASLRLTRHYAIVSGSPTFETWTTYTPATGAPALSDLNVLQLTLPAGTIHWVNGLQGDTADTESDAAFALQEKALAVGEQLALGAVGRASEQTVPWFAIDGGQDEFYTALLWSGAWSVAFDRTSAGLSVTLGLDPMTTTLRGAVDGPHALFGVVRGGLVQATAALCAYVLPGLRDGRPLTPLVTYNTWFAYGTRIDEATVRAEMARVSALGAELFVVDAGWYPDTGSLGTMDFDSGLGSWVPDPARFPDGLKPLRDYAQSLGMKFGLWVEPERISLSLIGAAGAEESWLATADGDYGIYEAAQLCLGSAAARRFILDWITRLIDTVQPDYLKWDNNAWVNCDRDGHGHDAADGNFAHVNGLYEVLAALRTRYPNLLIENVSGGGNRLDFGMLRYTDVGWMDDRSVPSVHVRHNIEGVSTVFPPAYLLSFVMEHHTEPLHNAPDLSLYLRSRMAAALGLCFRTDTLSEGDAANIAREIDIYKATRETLSAASAALLTQQAAVAGGPPWDVLQETTSASDALIFAYQVDEGVSRVTVRPTGLVADTTYDVQSVDTGVLGSAKGADLMANGIEILQSPNSAAHILIIRAQQ
jgi:alpha-galactosidase